MHIILWGTVLLLLTVARAQTRMQSVGCRFPVMDMFGDPCPRHHDPVRRWKAEMKKEFRGQENAVQRVEKAFKVGLFFKNTPTMLHFSGPTGVGKSFMAMLLAKAVFSRQQGSSICGYLDLRMTVAMREVQESRAEEFMETYLLRPIVEQIAVCPTSIIVIDDIHFLDSKFLQRLRGIFDEHNPSLMCTTGTYAGKRWSTRDSFFIVTSDLDEKHSDLHAGLSPREAENVIRRLAKQVWGEHSHMTSLITLVPFLPLSQNSLVSIAERQVEKLHDLIVNMLARLRPNKRIDWIGSVKYSKSLPSEIYMLKKDDTERFGARPINHYVEMHLHPLAIDIAEELLAHGAKTRTSESIFDSFLPNPMLKYVRTPVKLVNNVDIWLQGSEMKMAIEEINVNTKPTGEHTEL
ncbi:hypothetical protein AAMO2058_001651000 [Amorphochlora amoebiformis]|uniref:AAA+ ATPase domain-containing protein n=1 Tax=Amorphochlora amoebiformis TaxID=1561963 RepID=A0A7S0DN00_9EUKA|mmetsp:Transcript_3279/g.5024  ORF Transcript_3279/g.5024 Transcript_3279/m.5024 type:complete len:406 (+) Transcript_3279:110-1327(+)